MGVYSRNEIVQRDFTSLDLVKWRKVFDQLDEQHVGKIDANSLSLQISTLFKEVPQDKIQKIIIEKSTDNTLDFSNFLEILTTVKHSPEVVYLNFEKKIDVTRSGGGI